MLDLGHILVAIIFILDNFMIQCDFSRQWNREAQVVYNIGVKCDCSYTRRFSDEREASN